MRTRTPIVVSAILVIGVGAFFVGRASVSNGPVATTTSPTSIAVNTSFSPLSVDFSSLAIGWALGTTPCHGTSVCLSLSKTTDAGRSWTVSPLPQSLLHVAERRVDGRPSIQYDSLGNGQASQLNVRFANRDDGWIYGSLDVPFNVNGVNSYNIAPVLWSTHDGGHVWTSHPQSWIYRQSTILDLEATSHIVYLLALSKSLDVKLESSPVNRDHWRVAATKSLGIPAGGGELSGAIVLSGSRGWLIEGNDRGVSGSAQLSKSGTWVSWTPPCYSVGNSLSVPTAATANRLIAECQMGGYASPLSKSAPPGAKVGSTWLYQSENAGRTFTAVAQLGPNSENFGSTLAAPRPGTYVIARGTFPDLNLLASFDAGLTWSEVYAGNIAFMHFYSPNEGAALVAPYRGHNRLIMTFDGGHSWLPIPF
jgi:hypothetical protein